MRSQFGCGCPAGIQRTGPSLCVGFYYLLEGYTDKHFGKKKVEEKGWSSRATVHKAEQPAGVLSEVLLNESSLLRRCAAV